MTYLDHPRFVAKRQDDHWAVYDRRRASWPLVVPGYIGSPLQSFATEQDAADEADRLGAFYESAVTA